MPHLPSLPENAGPPVIYTRYPDIYEPWSQMSQAMMNGPSALDQGEREVILAYATGVAGCDFVSVAHSEVAYAWGIERGLIEKMLQDPETAPASPRLKVLLAFVAKLMKTPSDITKADVESVFAANWSEDALHDAVAITGRAAFMHRLVSAYGFVPMSREDAAKKAKKRLEHGYVNLYPQFREKK